MYRFLPDHIKFYFKAFNSNPVYSDTFLSSVLTVSTKFAVSEQDLKGSKVNKRA